MGDVNMVIHDFERQVDSIRDWPDKAIILGITRYAETHIVLSSNFCDLLVTRIMDPYTNKAYKLPLFYLIDSIIKHVGGPYPALFGRHIVDMFLRSFDEFNDSDRAKLDRLLTTWEERSMFVLGLSQKMRNHVIHGPRVVDQRTSTQLLAPPPPQLSIPQLMVPPAPGSGPAPPVSHEGYDRKRPFGDSRLAPPPGQQFEQFDSQGLGGYDGRDGPPAKQPYQPPMRQQDARDVRIDPRAGRGHGGRGGRGPYGPGPGQGPFMPSDRDRGMDRGPPTGHFPPAQQQPQPPQPPPPMQESAQELIQDPVLLSEMERILKQMYEEMGLPVATPSLDELKNTNMPLFEQIRKEAISSLNLTSIQKQHMEHVHMEQTVHPRGDMRPSAPREPGQAPRPGGGSRPAPINRDEFVNAFICEAPVLVNLTRARGLMQRLNQHVNEVNAAKIDALLSDTSTTIGAEGNKSDAQSLANISDNIAGNKDVTKSDAFIAASKTVAARLKELIENAYIPPKLPPMIMGPLPLEPSKEFSYMIAANSKAQQEASKPKPVMEKPTFRKEMLNVPPQHALKLLYTERQHQYADGVRFRTLAELAKYTDEFLARKEMSHKKKSSGEKVHRQWYCTASQWVTDFQSLGVEQKNDGGSGPKGDTPNVEQSGSSGTDEIFIVPADEAFTRCPVSKEVFETVWDDDEGEFMYRNAVKVLLTHKADEALYKVAQVTVSEGVKYLIVHKPLVLDGWLESGRADSLHRAKLRYEQVESTKGTSQALTDASGDGEDEDDVFVLLELAT